jgi:hypothetical protein
MSHDQTAASVVVWRDWLHFRISRDECIARIDALTHQDRIEWLEGEVRRLADIVDRADHSGRAQERS